MMWQAEKQVSEGARGTDAKSERLSERAFRFARALVVGSGATLVDFSLFTTCIRLVGMTPTAARLPALCAGASVQFFGNRTFTFRAQAGSLSRQARFFVVVELAALAMNYLLFRWLVPKVTVLPPELVSFIGTFVVFVTFAYPMRRLVIFKLPP
jgi:putative flippase GtrA